MRGFFTAIMVAFLSFAGIADGHELGPKIGDVIPNQLETLDSKGLAQSFTSLKGEKGAVLVFVRSADWCPYCQRQLIDLNEIAEDVEANGYKLITISYDAPEKLAKFKRRKSIKYPMLSDNGSVIIKAFGVLNPSYPEGHYAHGVPHPTVLVVDADGVVKKKFFSDDYKVRPKIEVILNAISTAKNL